MDTKLTHDQLIRKARTWLMKTAGCGFVLCELRTVGSTEIPDAIGFRGGHISILIECKATRVDFLSDKKKNFRRKPKYGMGAFRFYLAPKGLIQENELPDRWGLIEVKKTGKPVKKIGPKGNTWGTFNNWRFAESERNIAGEMAQLTSALRRLHLRGDLNKIYDYPGKRKE